MPHLRKILILPLFLFFNLFSYSQGAEDANCFSMLAGSMATVDGSVMIAHNEDDWGDLYVDWHKVERIQHEKGSVVQLEKGGIVDQVEETNAFFWLQMPGMQFSDSYMNEWGLTIASNQCRSREDNEELTDGGIGYFLRRLMIERAKTAREAVKIGGALVQQFGYHYSGRTYLIADKNEAWMMAVVKGKHWVAQRIPDDHVAVIPNYYTIQEIDLSDTLNFLGSPDIISYALDRGWFDPQKGKRFSFRTAYAGPETLYGIWNIPRHLSAINHLADSVYTYYNTFPFSFKPKTAVSHRKIMDVLQSHGEGSQFEISNNYNFANPHGTEIKRVCSEGNQYGFVAQLRKDFPDPIAHVMWLAPKRPCIQSFTPWYIGITAIPERFSRGDAQKCLQNHFTDEDLKSSTRNKAYWIFKEYSDACDKNHLALSKNMIAFKDSFQSDILDQQKTFERVFSELYRNDSNKAIDILNAYVGGLAERMLIFTENQIEKSKSTAANN